MQNMHSRNLHDPGEHHPARLPLCLEDGAGRPSAFVARNTFPQLPIRKIVSEEEADAFAKERGGRFPDPQFSPRLQLSEPGSKAKAVLVGDAIHAFPPDLGQGVNSALEDVVEFENSLDKRMSGDLGHKTEKERHISEALAT